MSGFAAAGDRDHVYDVAPALLWEATQEELLSRGELLEPRERWGGLAQYEAVPVEFDVYTEGAKLGRDTSEHASVVA